MSNIQYPIFFSILMKKILYWALGFGVWVFFFFILFTGNLSCLTRKGQPDPPVVLAIVDGYAIKEDAVRFRLNLEKSNYDDEAFNNPARFQELKNEILNRLVQNRIITEWGRRTGIVITDEELKRSVDELKKGYTEKEFEMMLKNKNIVLTEWRKMAEENLYAQKIIKEAVLKKIKITPSEIKNYYKKHRDKFQAKERVRVRHIVTDTFEKAKKLYDKIKQGESFSKIAIMHSLSPDRSTGGDLGYFSRGTHPKEFDETCFKLSHGDISPIVKSPYGYHIFKLIDKRPEETISLLEATPMIQMKLQEKKMAKAYKQWLNEISSQAQIQIMDEVLERLEL